ncbi:MAG TPA: acyltransferase family protein [Dongiaceae bacterium]|nr:acyltransferase family protein [Dongiaceae bacterium]
MVSDKVSGRIDYVDTARFLGIFLVYHGHVVERMMYLGNLAAAHQYKFIYSFHMPLFFVLSGFIAKDWAREESIGRFVRSRFASRVVPLLALNLLLALISLAHKPDFPPFPLVTAADYWNAAVMTVTQLTIFNVPTWFLMCLVSVEIIHFVVFRFLRDSTWRILGAMLAFYAVGYAINRRFDLFAPGDFGKPNWWLMYEAIPMYGFYLAGVLARRHGILAGAVRPAWLLLGAVAALVFVCATYDLNQGPFRLKIEAVVILAAAHGHWLWFPLTALVGSAAILLLGKLTEQVAWMRYLGRNALILMGLNGVVYHHVNGPFAAWYVAAMPADGWSVALAAALLSAGSIALAAPLVLLFNQWVPQLVGQPTQKGPLLPRFL